MAETILESIAKWVSDLRFEEIPPRVVEKARWQQASVLAASLAGLNDTGARKVLEATHKHGGSGHSCVLAGGFRTSRHAAVVANASASCTFDFDEILLLGHPGHSAVTVPLVLGEELGASWRDAVVAQVAANEVMARLGFATIFGPGNGQMLPFLHCAGAAIRAGRLLGLDASQMAHALAVALAQPPSAIVPAFLGSIESKVLVAAHGTSMGVHAAELAAEGFTGALDLLDHPRGLFHRVSFVHFPRLLTGFGRTWLSDTLQAKLNASCWYWQALLDALGDAARSLRDELERPLTPDDVRRVECRVTFLADSVDATERRRPHDRLTANEVNFSIPASAALTLLNGRLVPDDLTPERLAEQEAAVRSLASRIEVVHDRTLTRRLVAAVDAALDVPGIVGSSNLRQLTAAARELRHEFPDAGSIKASELLYYLSRAPSALMKLVEGQDRRYDLGDHDLTNFTLPIPGAFEIELTNGRRIEGEREVEGGALTLLEAPGRVANKLRMAAKGPLGAEAAEGLVRALAGAGPETALSDLMPQVGRR